MSRRGQLLDRPAAPAPADRLAQATTNRYRRFVIILAVIGPGIIAANAGNDAGGIITYASAGAEFGYRTLFFMVLVTVALVVVQEMCSRLGVFTGKGLAALIREEFSLRVAAFALVCLVVANVGLVVSEFAGIGAALRAVRREQLPLRPDLGGRHLGARAVRDLPVCGADLPGAVAGVPGLPGRGLPRPSALGDGRRRHRAAALPAVIAASSCSAWPSSAPPSRRTCSCTWPPPSPTRASASRTTATSGSTRVAGAIFGDIISMFIIIATAAAVRRHRASSTRPPTRPRRSSRWPAASPATCSASGCSARPPSPAPSCRCRPSYAISEAVGVERSVSRRFREAPLFLGLFTGQVVIGAAVALVTSQPGPAAHHHPGAQRAHHAGDPRLHPRHGQPPQSLLGDAANGPVFRTVSTVCVAVVGALSLVVLAQTVLSLFGV